MSPSDPLRARFPFLDALGAEHVSAGAPTEDIARFGLGTPLLVARPADEAEVAAIVGACADQGVAVVPIGRRTAYWRPLHLERAVALDLRRLDTVEWADGAVRCGAGAPVRALDVALRGRGFHLPIHPDAFGETSLAASAAIACTSGIGMGNGPIARWITGLSVVTGEGALLRTGGGVPDLTGAFLGAEGGLGVITRVDLALVKAPWRVRLGFVTDRILDVVALGRDLAGLYDTFRAVRAVEPGRAATGFATDLWIQSPFSAAEARSRADQVAARIRTALGVAVEVEPEPEAARAGVSPAYDARWQGPIGGHEAFGARAALVGMDVNAPYGLAPELLALAAAQQAEALGGPASQARIAVYLAPELVNLGLHVTVPPEHAAWGHDHQRRWLDALAALPVVPYRLGRTWPAALRDRRDPGATGQLRALKQQLDPRGILHPGQPLFA